MTPLTIRLPDSLHREIKQLAQVEGISINHFLTLAAAEKISALRTVDYLRAEASKGSRADVETRPRAGVLAGEEGSRPQVPHRASCIGSTPSSGPPPTADQHLPPQEQPLVNVRFGTRD